MIYLDTSVLVPLFVAEPQSGAVRGWFEAHADEAMAISDWSLAEFVSAMGIKVRRKDFKAEHALRACEVMRASVEESMEVLVPARSTYGQAAGLLGHFSSGLRAGDALHLAVALEAEVDRLYTLDERFIVACRKLKVDIRVTSPI
jgi:predicted nucleic acid-binding protein